MRRFLLLLILVSLVFAALGLTSGVVLAEAAPFKPGNILFPVQYFAEQQAFFRNDPDQRAAWFLMLTLRRIEDVSDRAGFIHQMTALEYLNRSLDQAALALADASPETTSGLQYQLKEILYQAAASVEEMSVSNDAEARYLNALQVKIATLRDLVTNGDASAEQLEQVPSLSIPVAGESSEANTAPEVDEANPMGPLAVPFPEGSLASEHDFFPLVGRHGEIECEACHTEGNYQGTTRLCQECHNAQVPADHYAGECQACHTPTAWTDVIFDHAVAGATDCVSCHNDAAPANHYPGQCSNCHNTNGWLPASFDHSGFSDCASCHAPPDGHYQGQCSQCHNTGGWEFNHPAGASDCSSCHAAPQGHYIGQCSACHSTSGWLPVTFDHTLVGANDCNACHSENAPANHYQGQCSACHSTGAWLPASFNHSGFSNCQNCHSAPSNHYGGQCSTCHNTNAWRPASFNHSGFSDCQACHTPPGGHYSGQCSKCHNTNNWRFNHSGQADCSSCHNPPGGHYGGQCSQCHNTNNWHFDHSSGSDCRSCHSGHTDQQCSDCHNTSDWDDAEGDKDGHDDKKDKKKDEDKKKDDDKKKDEDKKKDDDD